MNSFHVSPFKFPIVQENQIVQPNEAERQPLKICIDLKKNSTSIEMDRKQKKKEEKKKAKEEKKRKRKKERDVKRLLKKWKNKDKNPLANESAAAPVKCNKTPQKPIQPIAQKKIRLREVSSTSQEVIKSTIPQAFNSFSYLTFIRIHQETQIF